jgi:hypothetical protein
MKKLVIVTSAAFLMFTAVLNAQTDSTVKQPVADPAVTQPAATEKPASKDKYNNWSADTYKMQPMPEALTTEKIFPVLGKYQITDKEGTASTVTVSLDPENKGLIWVEGLPQGKIKANLRKSPATYKIPVQPLEGEVATEVAAVPEAKEGKAAKDAKSAKNVKAAKELPEGVLIYDKDANVLSVCIGCTYNSEDPAVAFTASEPVATEPEKVEKKSTKASKKSTAKVVKIKPVHYTGNKVIETTAAVESH